MTTPSSHDPLRERLRERLGAQYEVESLLGQGGMGSVYRARDLTLDRPVAIKVIAGDVAANTQLRDRFLLEARTVAKLRHPNLVAVYSAGDADGLLYFVMELVPGESLRDLLSREGKVEKSRAERILHELALALDYAHANGIVHRDVKPENILLDRDTGRAMLTDFGVARALEGDGRMTGTGMILGSPRYMSPEQASGESTLDGRSDLYSLALVGYEMFTGRPVVESANIAGMLVKHLTETPKPLADAVPDVPEGVATSIDRALSKDRAARWETGREMAEAIAMAWTPTGITPGTLVRAANTVRLQLPRTSAGRRRAAFVAGGALFAVIVSLWALFGRGDRGADPRRSYAVMPFDVQTGNPDVQWMRDGAVNMLTLALGQWRDLSVVDYERTLVLARDAGVERSRVDLERAREIARRGGAGTVVMGLITTTADSLVVDARLYDVRSGEALDRHSMRAIALGADPRPLFDELARYLLDAAGGSPSASVELARATTTSLEAYRSYLDGVRLLNSWQLSAADSAFGVALRADSTFALAWHKRSLALGWSAGDGAAYVAASVRATELADRLPAREQALVRGHAALARALGPQRSGDFDKTAGLKEAQRIYTALLSQDSLVAEGWYGLADAYFHDEARTDSLPAIVRRTSNSVRAFHRTLSLDSTFHLAYSHLIQQYQMMSNPNAGMVIDGDSVRQMASAADVRAAGGAAAVDALRARATARGQELSHRWLRADPDAPEPYIQLATAYLRAGLSDSAMAVMDRALVRPALNGPDLKLSAATFQLSADDPRAFATMQEVTKADVATLRAIAINHRIDGLAGTMSIAAAAGHAAELDRVTTLFARVDTTFPFSAVPTRRVLEWYEQGLRLAMGAPVTSELRHALAIGVREADAVTGVAGDQVRLRSGAIPFTAYLATRDTFFSNAVRRWSPPGTPHTDLDALEALARGDTAAARTIARTFLPPDSLRKAQFAYAGLRTMARAEVLIAIGDTTRALAYYEALAPERFARGLADPGFAAYTRSFAARARIHEDRGEIAKAIAAWEEFLRRFAQGDALVEPQRAEARDALRRLRDVSR